MKKLLCLFCAAALLFGFAACGKNDPADPVKEATTAKEQYIDAKVGENLQKTELAKTDEHTYYLTTLQGKQVLCRDDLQNRLKVLLNFGGEPKFYPDTFKRSGGKMLYYTYQNKGDETPGLYAFNISTERAMQVLGSPCSNFILLNMPETFEMYAYGFVAGVDGVKVINLQSGGASAQYSMTVSQMKIFFVDPDSHPDVLFGKNLATTVTDVGDRTHVRLDTVETRGSGAVKRQWSVLFTPALGVVKEVEAPNEKA